MRLFVAFLSLAFAFPLLAQPKQTVLAKDLKLPESVCVAPDGKVYVSQIGERGKDGDGVISLIENGEAKPFATGLDDPRGLVAVRNFLFVTDNKRVRRIDPKGQVTDVAKADAFPVPPIMLNDITADPRNGTLFVSDSGADGKGGAVYKIPQKGKIETVLDTAKLPGLVKPNGVCMDGEYFLLVGDMGTGIIHRVNLATGAIEKVADGLGAIDGIAWDMFGRLLVSDWAKGTVHIIPKLGDKPLLMVNGLQSAADITVRPAGNKLLVPDMKAGTVVEYAIQVPGMPVDDSPLEIKHELAFPKLQFTGWKGETDAGALVNFRPIVLTHFGDGTNRVVLATQQGVIHTFKNDPAVEKTDVFIDLTDRVKYSDKTNEEGFLGLAIHPKFKEKGEFFVFYTPKEGKMRNVLSRFRVKKDDATKGDPASEEILMTFEKPYWNHDGGTIAFGPDGYLYITHGDGGLGNDPHENGQNLNTLLGKILRIDVDAKGENTPYAIPKDNPFVGQSGKRPEIWASGCRNLWRFSFDRETGKLWAADVGQNLFEEINIVEKGANLGWNQREGTHPFSVKGMPANAAMTDPIWEYAHDIGKSITGGNVYRGKAVPELAGHYLYADYVTGKVWALKYDHAAKRVTVNRPLPDKALPIMSFGEDEKGEVYMLTYSSKDQGIYKFIK